MVVDPGKSKPFFLNTHHPPLIFLFSTYYLRQIIQFIKSKTDSQEVYTILSMWCIYTGKKYSFTNL